jgi:transposase
MSMGKRKREAQADFWVATAELPQSGGHPFYEQLNKILDAEGFDQFAEDRCAKFYAEKMGRPSLAPARYFRMLLIGYFEGIDSERGIAWRVADSLALRRFLGHTLTDLTADHSTISRNRRLIDLETHEEVFKWVLRILALRKLLDGKTSGVDSTTLEANAALRSIVRRDTGETYNEFLTGLAKASGIETPTRADLAKIDKDRKNKGSNEDWRSPSDPDAKITKMKDGRTHLAHKSEHAVDMKTGAILAVTLQPANEGDTSSIGKTLDQMDENLCWVMKDDQACSRLSEQVEREVVADKGYHSNEVLKDQVERGIRSYISEPERGRRNWQGATEEETKEKFAARDAVYGNRRRIRGERGKRLMRQRGELLERSFAHCYETGGMRRTHLRTHENILKRLLIHTAGFNLSLILRGLLGVGTARGMQDLAARILALIEALWRGIRCQINHCAAPFVKMYYGPPQIPKAA